MLDHVIPLNERHLRRLGREYPAIITKTAHTSAWTRPRRPGDPSNYVLPKRAAFSLCLESAVFITATIGQKLPNWRYNIPSFIDRHIRSKNSAERLGSRE